ncbi:helix-turn-helix domain-containing protein [Cupriavidus basilensis]|uniref:Helix-turn-helix domain-containing protein n=1 Tax=Cupriavidus basilensis TaxID=68895 RepID=A0ABT6B261_9BURK|nr:helix-turn-helix domain-containing protein [Cupriavidus basilensis]MDF3838016.1 helix-turn-helix domain-containing protein [Cupriavidus basilensis]
MAGEGNAAWIEAEQPCPRRPVQCPVEDWLAFLGHRWNALVLWHLSAGEKRFGELEQCLPGIASKVLSERLDGLLLRGLIVRLATATFPRGTVYQLSPKGARLIGVLDRLDVWAREDACD